MRFLKRFGIVTGCLLVTIVSLAFIGLQFHNAGKSMSWMPLAFLIFFTVQFFVIGWVVLAAYPNIKSKRLRFTARGVSFVLALPITAYLSFTFYIWLWLLFGGTI
jgi:hypothetical protein